MSRFPGVYALLLSLFALAQSAGATPYIEAGTELGSLSNGQKFFGQSDASASNSGFLGSLSIYFPVTSERNFFHAELGLQNRVLNTSGSTLGVPLVFASNEISARIEIYRFYVGGGYAPLTYVNKTGGGLTSLHLNSGNQAWMAELGAIWRVTPELQIVATYAREYGLSSGSGTSPNISEYGLRFRFPLNPSENMKAAGGKQFDGFRYPFGFMK